ncbi:unnamed protein product [Strongylus vulgaris]|uniref:Uncharacterized protein n=1 Tax=Strongylus vulgaris TaxID=40348 RepID=A0A3P7IV79_STRVU|nr:unnamed protein product [Strongylus vulgaris]
MGLTSSKRRNIEEEEWYHGLRTRDDVAYVLLNHYEEEIGPGSHVTNYQKLLDYKIN